MKKTVTKLRTRGLQYTMNTQVVIKIRVVPPGKASQIQQRIVGNEVRYVVYADPTLIYTWHIVCPEPASLSPVNSMCGAYWGGRM